MPRGYVVVGETNHQLMGTETRSRVFIGQISFQYFHTLINIIETVIVKCLCLLNILFSIMFIKV